MSGGCATDSEAEEDYVNRVTPERRPVVNLRGGIKRDQLQSGVDFEIEDLENFHNQELPLEEPDDEYLSEICSEFNPSRMAGLSMSSGNSDDSDSTFDALKRKMDDITSIFSDQHTKLIYKRVLEDAGENEPAIRNGLVTVHYSAYLEGQDEPFDSTRRRKFPQTFRIGDGTVLEGLECGIKTMRINERSQFIVNHVLAYRENGVTKLVPKNAEVLFDVTVLNCIGGDAIEELEQKNLAIHENESDVSRSMKLHIRAAKEEMDFGLTYFKEKNWSKASKYYNRAKNYINDATAADEEEDQNRIRLYAKICRNNARALFEWSKYDACLRECKEVLDFFPNDPSANLYKGKCLLLHPSKEDVTGAIRAYRNGLQGKPNSVTLNEALNNALARQREEADASCGSGAEDIYRVGMARMFGGGGNSLRKGKRKLRKNSKYNQLSEDFKQSIELRLKKVSEGQKEMVTFPAFEWSDLEMDYLRSAVEDEGLALRERGSGLDSNIAVFKS